MTGDDASLAFKLKPDAGPRPLSGHAGSSLASVTRNFWNGGGGAAALPLSTSRARRVRRAEPGTFNAGSVAAALVGLHTS